MQNVLVTGGTGFIGRVLVAELRRRNCRVRVLARNERPDLCAADEWFCADLATPATLAGAARGCDTLFHLAGYAHATSRPYPDEVEHHRRINLAGTRAVLEDALSAGVERFVYASSVKAAGEDASRCIDETTAIEPVDPYGRIKRDCEQEVLSACAARGVHAAVIRPALVYGAGVKGNIAAMAAWIRKGVFPPLPDTGNIRSMVEVRDLVQALLAAADRPQARGGTYIITDGEAYSSQRVYLALRRALGKPEPRVTVPAWLLRLGGRSGDGLERLLRRPLPLNSTHIARLLDSACYRSVRARQDLDFQPRYRFEDVVTGLLGEGARG
ncbi:MAG: NAD-dependent epimerase/dehydratase family protein [Gammaproteobacteria bacterium]